MADNVIPLPNSNIALSEGEILVRQYFITYSGWPKSRGDVAVTNKRVIYQGKGRSSTSMDEVPLETVSSISTYYGKGFRIAYIILAVLCFIGMISGFVAGGGGGVMLALVLLVLTAIFAFLSYNTGYALSISSSGAVGTPISVGRSDIVENTGGILRQLFSSTTGQGAAFSVNADPTEQAIQMMNELGAMVMDLKIMGDRAVEKWQNFQSVPVNPREVPRSWRSRISLPEMSPAGRPGFGGFGGGYAVPNDPQAFQGGQGYQDPMYAAAQQYPGNTQQGGYPQQGQPGYQDPYAGQPQGATPPPPPAPGSGDDGNFFQ